MKEFAYLLGKQFMLPVSHNLFEIYHIFWDAESGKLAGYRRSCQGIQDSRDRLAYEVEGPYGLAALTSAYEQHAGLSNCTR